MAESWTLSCSLKGYFVITVVFYKFVNAILDFFVFEDVKKKLICYKTLNF